MLEHCDGAVSDLSARLATAENNDDVDALAAIIGACQLVEERASAALNGRIAQTPDIDDVKAAQKTALGW